MYDKKGKINKKETPFEDAHNATLKRIRDRFGTKDIVKKLEDALENAHEAKQLLQSFSLTTDSFTDANRLIIDLEITVKSLKGQILGEENNDKNRD